MAKKAKGLTIAQRPNGSWRAQIRKTGYPYATKDFLTHEQADEWGLAKLAEIQRTGTLIDRKLSEKVTLADVIEEYIEDVVSIRRSKDSREAETYRLRRFVRVEANLCAYAVAYITPQMLKDWRDRRLTQKVSRGTTIGKPKASVAPPRTPRLRRDGTPVAKPPKPKPPSQPLKTISAATVKKEMETLKRIFDFAMQEHNLASNPMADKKRVKRPAVNDERDVRLTIEERVNLLAACMQARNKLLAPAVEIGFETGMRRSSLLKLTWSDVNLLSGAALLRDVKNSKNPDEILNFEIGLSPRAIEILNDLPRSNSGFVFPITKDAFRQAFNRARDRAGLKHFRYHDTRHEMASTLVEAGWPMPEVMAQGVWRDPKSMIRYYGPRGAHLSQKLANLKKNI